MPVLSPGRSGVYVCSYVVRLLSLSRYHAPVLCDAQTNPRPGMIAPCHSSAIASHSSLLTVSMEEPSSVCSLVCRVLCFLTHSLCLYHLQYSITYLLGLRQLRRQSSIHCPRRLGGISFLFIRPQALLLVQHILHPTYFGDKK